MLQLSGEVLGVLEGAGARGERPRLSVVEVRWLLDALGESLCGLMLSGGLGGLLATEAGVGGVRTGGCLDGPIWGRCGWARCWVWGGGGGRLWWGVWRNVGGHRLLRGTSSFGGWECERWQSPARGRKPVVLLPWRRAPPGVALACMEAG